MPYYNGFENVLLQLFTEAKNYDMINLTLCDMNCCHRTKSIPADVFERVMKGEGGIGMFTGTYCLGPNTSQFLPETLKKYRYADLFLVPTNARPYVNEWNVSAAKYDQKILEVISDLYWKGNESEMMHSPRHAANRLLKQLQNKDLSLYSAVEYEFTLYKKDGVTPAWNGPHIYNNQILQDLEYPILQLRKALKKAGVPIRSINSEYGDGQLEITIFPKFGIEAADDAFIFKQAVLEIFKQNDFKATFMSKSSETAATNSGHYNFSIWDTTSNKNLFYDPKSEDNLSSLAHQFISGIITHAKGLCALLSPTANCYRRLKSSPFVPFIANWGIECREALIRVKNETESNTYLELRASSGLCNPYLVMTGVIAAGLDGVARELSVPACDGKIDSNDDLPNTLEEALNFLENDHVLVQSIGKEFIAHFIEFKRTLEVSFLEGYDSFERERDLYMPLS